jgi:hypothetical protein
MTSTVRSRLVLSVAAAAGLLLAGAVVFGLWHVVVGWLLHGNPRAGTFGIVLAAIAGTLLAGLAFGIRRSGVAG